MKWKDIDQLLLPYKFCGRGMYRIYFFIFGSRESLKVKPNLSMKSIKRKTFKCLLNQINQKQIVNKRSHTTAYFYLSLWIDIFF